VAQHLTHAPLHLPDRSKTFSQKQNEVLTISYNWPIFLGTCCCDKVQCYMYNHRIVVVGLYHSEAIKLFLFITCRNLDWYYINRASRLQHLKIIEVIGQTSNSWCLFGLDVVCWVIIS
jgi:hypothetical protein